MKIAGKDLTELDLGGPTLAAWDGDNKPSPCEAQG